MQRAQRLRTRRDFAQVYQKGRAYRSGLLVLRALSTGAPSRFGFTTGVAIGNAVVRNRLKRRLREIVRSLGVPAGWDVVLNARRGAGEVDYWRLQAQAKELMERAGLLSGPVKEAK
jgi:ribonuclease P protein component